MIPKTVKTKPRLGRGLSSLIGISDLPVQVELPDVAVADATKAPNEAKPPTANAASVEIDVAKVSPNPHQPRKQVNEQSIAELAATLKSTGLIQPIIVRRQGDGYQLIAGERRWRAAKLAGLATIPAIIRDIDSPAQAQMALVENIQREDLNPLDRAQAYRALIQQLGLTQAELATRLGEDRSSVANYLRLLELAEPVRAMLRDGQISLGHAKILAGIPDILEQQRLAELVASQGLAVRNLERLLEQVPADPKAARATAAVSPHIQELEKSLARQLGMRIQIRSASQKGRGRLIIHYSCLDQFDSLLAKMGLAAE